MSAKKISVVKNIYKLNQQYSTKWSLGSSPQCVIKSRCWLRMFRKSVKDRHKFFVTEKTVCYRQILPVISKDCLWQKYTVCDRKIVSVTDKDCLRQKHSIYWQTHTVYARSILSIKTNAISDGHRLFMAETYSVWQPGTV